jgi:voltage-gated potassium channel Kch
MGRGTPALIAALVIVDALLALLVTGFILLGRVQPEELAQPNQLAWRALVHTIDPAALGEDRGHPLFVFLMFAGTIAGLFVFGTLVGIITSGIDRQVERLRRGRSLVLESGHSLILGWSPQIFGIVRELVTANRHRRDCIVVLADRDKVEMEEDIHAHLSGLGRMRIVVRTGDPLEHADLAIANPQAARAIIVLPPEGRDPDTQVIKTILAITNDPNRRPEPYHIVTQLRHRRNLEVARLAARGEATFILDDELITRMTAQSCRQSGLSLVYTELLDFGGEKIVLRPEPSLTGKTFAEAVMAHENGSVIGVHRGDGDSPLNPSPDTVLQEGDRIVSITREPASVRVAPSSDYVIAADRIQTTTDGERLPERTLILGWNQDRAGLVEELDNYVATGSVTTIVDDTQEAPGQLKKITPHLQNQSVEFQTGDTTDADTLAALNVPSYDHVVVLSDADTRNAQQADARTLVTLLHLRRIHEQNDRDFSIISEMLDLRNRELAEATRADDFIVSDHLVSLLTAQLAENAELRPVYDDLFDAEGAELYLKPAERYVRLDEPVNFYTVLEAGLRRKEIPIGYRVARDEESVERGYGIVITPDKAAEVTFRAGDRLIVVADD